MVSSAAKGNDIKKSGCSFKISSGKQRNQNRVRTKSRDDTENKKENGCVLYILYLLIFTIYPNQEVFLDEKSELMILNRLTYSWSHMKYILRDRT